MAKGYSEACCKIPPVQAEYTPKGEYIQLGGLKTYKTGAHSKTVLLLIYDVFGFSPQILQGADLLAGGTSNDGKTFQVFMPDFMKGTVADPAWFTGAEGAQEKMAKFFGPGGPCFPPLTTEQVSKVVKEIKEGGAEKIGVMGYCWGGKIVSLVCGENTPFSAGVEVHPSALEVEDAAKITVPLCMLPSQDEDAETVKKFEADLKVPKYFETFGNSPHGWMAARGDLSGPDKPNYERGYTLALEWFNKYV